MITETNHYLGKTPENLSKDDIYPLQKVITFHRELYTLKESPVISDKEYDELFQLLVKLEDTHGVRDPSSPTQRPESHLDDQFKKVAHAHPMKSLANTYDAADLRDFEKRIRNILGDGVDLVYGVELKFDGLGVALTYEHGKLVRAATRGNGTEGEEITLNILQIADIPRNIPSEEPSLEVRGEIIMPISSFQSLNARRQASGEKLFANPRNAASGSVRQKDYHITAERNLHFYAYSSPDIESASVSYVQFAQRLADLGFRVSPTFESFDSIEGVIDYIEKTLNNTKPEFDFEIDGLVIKVDNIDLWETLGVTAHHPRYSISYKFPAEYERTKVLSIEHSVGRTGAITPVANVEPVNIGGVVVRRATLHNYDELNSKGVRIGDHVFIHRAGEVIPEIISPIIELRTGEELIVETPVECPLCGAPTYRDGVKIALMCSGDACPAKILGSLEYFVSKSGLDIDGMGPKQVELFYEKGWVQTFADIFTLASFAHEILSLEGFQETSVNNLLESIEKARSQPEWRVFSALGIAGVGKQTAKSIVDAGVTAEGLLAGNYSAEELEDIKDIGPETAQSLISFFEVRNSEVCSLMEQISIQDAGSLKSEAGSLTGKSFCVTGTFDTMKRGDIHELIESHGGEVRTSVTKNLDMLICGEKAGSKRTKAEDLGVKIIELTDFLDMIEEHETA